MHPMRQLIMLVEAPVEGLPPDAEIADRRINNVLARGGHRPVVKPGIPSKWDSRRRYQLELHPNSDRAKPFPMRKNDERNRVSYYDPEMADLHTPDPDFEYARTYPKLKAHLTQEITPLPGDDIIYRGMSSEEFENFQKTGAIVSKGDYNIGDQQKGLTYWTTQPESAKHYANGFAPLEHKPTFNHPAYVVAAKMPKETRHVAGVGDHEIGVARPIAANEIIGVWRGTVFGSDTGSYDLLAHDGDRQFKVGSSSSADNDVAWERLK